MWAETPVLTLPESTAAAGGAATSPVLVDSAPHSLPCPPEGIWLHMIRQTLTLNRILNGIGGGDRGVLYKAGISCGHDE